MLQTGQFQTPDPHQQLRFVTTFLVDEHPNVLYCYRVAGAPVYINAPNWTVPTSRPSPAAQVCNYLFFRGRTSTRSIVTGAPEYMNTTNRTVPTSRTSPAAQVCDYFLAYRQSDIS